MWDSTSLAKSSLMEKEVVGEIAVAPFLLMIIVTVVIVILPIISYYSGDER